MMPVAFNLKAWSRRGVSRATLLLVVLAVLSVAAPLRAAPSGAEVLLAMTRAGRTASYRGTVVVRRPGAPTIKARVWKHGPQRRLEFQEPQVMRGDLLVDDGTHIWRYHRSENAAVQTRSAPSNALKLGWKQLQSRYTANVTGTTVVAGRKAWIVTLAPRGGGPISRKFWVDQQTKVPLRIEQYAGGHLAETVALQSVAFEPVSAAKFQWSTPRGAKLTTTGGTMYAQAARARRAAAWLKLPAVVPADYAFESAIVDNSRHEAWLRYTNGLHRFSIFQQRAAGGGNSRVRPVNGAWFWQKDGFRFLVVGLSEAQAKSISDSMR
jgi:outer membrane lipoprotein-sorting protein